MDNNASAKPTPQAKLRGPVKVQIYTRLGEDWRRLADWLEVAPERRAAFAQGYEGQAILEWLDERRRLAELPEALHGIGRGDLAELLSPPPSPAPDADTPDPEALRRYFGRASGVSGRGGPVIDKRFVSLTLLVDDQDEPRGQPAQSVARFESLNALLARVAEPGVVVLGRPGAGKSTVLRQHARVLAAAALEEGGVDDFDKVRVVPFYAALNTYRPDAGD